MGTPMVANYANLFMNMFETSLLNDFHKKNWKETLKDAVEGLRQFLESESPLKKLKNAFYFTLKALFILKIFKFLS